MRKYLNLVFVSLMMFLPFKVNALTDSLTIKCADNVLVGATFTCSLTGSVSGEGLKDVTSLSAKIDLGDNFEFVSFNQDMWQGDASGGIIEFYSPCDTKNETKCGESVTGTFDIGILQVKAKSNVGTYDIKIHDIKYHNNTTTNYKIEDASDSVVVSRPGLKSLAISDENGKVSLSPEFSSSNYSYSVTINSKKFSVEATPVSTEDTVKVYNAETNELLNVSDIVYDSSKESMVLTVKVGTGDNVPTYSIIVNNNYQDEEVVCNSSLSSLVVGGVSISLSKDKYDYEVELDDISKYSYKAVLSDSDNYQFDSILVGEKTDYTGDSFSIKVVPKNDKCTESSTYNVTVKKKATVVPSNPSSSKPSSSKPSSSKPSSSGEIKNPQTSDISAFLIIIVLIGSFVVSINLYKKNIDGYEE